MAIIKITAILMLLTVVYFIYGIEYCKKHHKEWMKIQILGERPIWMKVGATILTFDAIFIILSAGYLLFFR